jgi:hypothetical protein
MTQDFTVKNNRAWADACEGATSPQELRERLIEMTERQRGAPQAPALDAPVPESGRVRTDQMCERVLYPRGNARITIVGSSEQDLDQQEAQIREAFGSQR